jgi:hypothetical protein
MKAVNVHFEDKEIEYLLNLKKDNSWHDFILKLAKFKENKDE